MSADFHKERRAWFQIKHQIVGTYLSLFLGKLGKSDDRVYYVDGFAGQGRLDDGTEGSALIAAELAAESPTLAVSRDRYDIESIPQKRSRTISSQPF